MRFAMLSELDAESGKRRCTKRQPGRSRVSEVEPENSKGRADTETPKNGAITC